MGKKQPEMDRPSLITAMLAEMDAGKIPVCRSEYGDYLIKDVMDALDAAGYDTMMVDFSRAKDRRVLETALGNPARAFKRKGTGRTAVVLDRIWLCEPMVLFWSVAKTEQLPEKGVPVIYCTDFYDERFCDSAVYTVLDLDVRDPDNRQPRYVPPPSHWDVKYGRAKKPK